MGANKMVTAQEALALEKVDASIIERYRDGQKLTPEEDSALKFMEGMIDSAIYGYFNGSAFAVVNMVTPKVATAVKRLYEGGGWTVWVQPWEYGKTRFVLGPR